MKAIRFHHNGGPEVLSYEDIVMPEFSEGEVLVKLKAPPDIASLNPSSAPQMSMKA